MILLKMAIILNDALAELLWYLTNETFYQSHHTKQRLNEDIFDHIRQSLSTFYASG